MSRFLQLHLLTSYPPANLNRDDLGRPKTAKMGGVDRLRVSSQSLKRTWRTSELFKEALEGHMGTRTKRLGSEVFKKLSAAGIPEKKAKEWAQKIASQFGKLKKEGDELEIEQLVHISPAEQAGIDDLTNKLIAEQRAPNDDELNFLRKDDMAVDIAMFGRMLASKPEHNVEAACQVAHAISVHGVVIEDDYFTAVDDLNDHSEDAGAAHIGETGFAAGLFYSYICINRELLVENLGGNKALADKAIRALTEAAVKVAPQGKQNSFGSRAYASYVRAELGSQQPRSLSVAFLKPLGKNSEDYAHEAVAALEKQATNFDEVYGPCVDSSYSLNAFAGAGKMTELLDFAVQ
jgi:CRISPR system Cascade subunit CasC